MNSEFAKKLEPYIKYFLDNRGKWIDLDDVVLPALEMATMLCRDCGRNMKIQLYLHPDIGTPFYKIGNEMMRFSCSGCGRNWIDKEELQA
jgi:hypothetical protein